MFYKKDIQNIIYILIFVLLIIQIIIFKNSLFSHWSHILDQDVTIIYNALLLSSNINQEYLDHPAYTTLYNLNIVFKLFGFLNLIDVYDVNGLIKSENKDFALQALHNISQVVQISYSLLLLILIYFILNYLINDKFSSFILTLICLLSPSFLFLLELVRSEILSLVCLLLYFICLSKYQNGKIIYVFFSGIFLILSLLAKVQVIIMIYPLIILNFLIDFKFKKKFNNIKFSNYIIIPINIFIIIFVVYFIDNYQYKRVDKILFIFFISFHFIYFYFTDRKKFINFNFNFSFLIFLLGCISTIIFFKFSNFLNLSSFHPALTSIIGSPLSQMSNINTGYQTSTFDNIEFIKKVYEFFIFSIIEGSHFGKNEFDYRNAFVLVFNKLSNLTYSVSILLCLYCILKKKYYELFLILYLNISITCINFAFNFRPYNFYLIYSLPLNLILICILLNIVGLKKIFSIILLFIFIYMNYNEINFFIKNPRLNTHPIKNMETICLSENINNKGSYMSYWQKKYNAKFLSELCEDYQTNYKSLLKE